MLIPRRTALTLATACVLSVAGMAPAQAADSTDLTLYRSDNAALYASSGGSVDAGYAVVREQRLLDLRAGTHDVVIGNLPRSLDAEALALGFPDGDARVMSQRLLLAQAGEPAQRGISALGQ